jgi:hypothetical protein
MYTCRSHSSNIHSFIESLLQILEYLTRTLFSSQSYYGRDYSRHRFEFARHSGQGGCHPYLKHNRTASVAGKVMVDALSQVSTTEPVGSPSVKFWPAHRLKVVISVHASCRQPILHLHFGRVRSWSSQSLNTRHAVGVSTELDGLRSSSVIGAAGKVDIRVDDDSTSQSGALPNPIGGN